MDDLEFRRKIIAEPSNIDAELSAIIDSDDIKAQFVTEIKQLDQEINQAMAVPVPDNLAAQLLLKQSFELYRQERKSRVRWSIAMAASVIFTVTLGLSHLFYNPIAESRLVSDYALEHYYHELGYADQIDEQQALNQVNAKLASFGATLTDNIGHVYYANFCDLYGLKSLHMVMQGVEGKVTVFVLPKSEKLEGWEPFVSGEVKGESIRFDKADIIMIGEESNNIKAVKQRLQQHLQWQA